MRLSLLGCSVPSAFVLWNMRELPPPIKIHKQEQSREQSLLSAMEQWPLVLLTIGPVQRVQKIRFLYYPLFLLEYKYLFELR